MGKPRLKQKKTATDLLPDKKHPKMLLMYQPLWHCANVFVSKTETLTLETKRDDETLSRL